MLALFRRKRADPSAATAAPPKTPKGWSIPKTAAALLATRPRQRLIEQIWQRTSLSREQFAALYRSPIERYAALVQDFPASQAHHHAYSGGMLDHTLDVVAYAMKLRQSHLLPVAAPPETQAFQAEAWTAGIAYAALLHDIGKIAVDLHVEYDNGECWHPWHGALHRPYRFRYREDREYRLHGAAAGLLYTKILDALILDWLSGFPDLWAALLYALSGQLEHAGILGEIVMQADQASVAVELGGDPSKARTAPKQALQRKLLDGLRHLVRTDLKLNQPRGSDGWLTHDALWLVSKTVCDKLRAFLLSQGIEGIPDDNVRLFSELQDHGIAQPNVDGKAIWKAVVTSGNGDWSHAFTFLKISPALIWDSADRPAPFTGSVQMENSQSVRAESSSSPELSSASRAAVATPSPKAQREVQDAIESALSLLTPPSTIDTSVARETNEPRDGLATPKASESLALQGTAEPAIVNASEDCELPGARFCTWLRLGIAQRRIIVNDAKALVHSVAGTAYLVTPGIFMRYVQEHPELNRIAAEQKMAGWQWVQKQFERMRIHRKQANGLNVWTCEVQGPRKTRRLHGYVLEDPRTVFSDMPPDNPYLTLLTDTAIPDPRSLQPNGKSAGS
jgi:integrating conjugative element relaxase (TIGR03760 family)